MQTARAAPAFRSSHHGCSHGAYQPGFESWAHPLEQMVPSLPASALFGLICGNTPRHCPYWLLAGLSALATVLAFLSATGLLAATAGAGAAAGWLYLAISAFRVAFEVRRISTRRFSARPCWLSLAARGMSEPRPLTIRRFCLRPLRRKIEVKARARWWLSSRLALTSPLLSAWPRISTPMVSSLSSSLAMRLSGPRVVGNIICGRSGLNEPCTGAVTTRRFSRRSNSKWVPLIASRTFGSYTSNQAWVTAGGGIGTTFGAALSDFSNRLHPLISPHRAMARVLLASIGYPRRDKQKKAGQWPAQTAGHAMLRSSLAELAINNQPIDAQVFAHGGPSRRTVLGYW